MERSLAKQGYITSAIGELPFFFEGLRAKKAVRLDCYISVDVYVYYHRDNYYFRPNSHKPLKQNRAYALLFIFLVKAARLHFRSKTSAIKYLDNISKFVFNLIAKLYFSFAQTTQFAIPDNFFHSMDKIRVNGKLVNKPRDVQKYLEWRYGCNWKKQNKNWRLTDGSMVFLGGLSSYQRLFLESPTAMSMRAPTPKLDRSAIQSMQKNGKYSKTNTNSLFKFSKAEIAKLKKLTLNLYNQLLSRSLKMSSEQNFTKAKSLLHLTGKLHHSVIPKLLVIKKYDWETEKQIVLKQLK